MNTRRRTRPHPLAGRVAEAIRRHGIIQPHDRVLAAVSGGPDSVCLLTVLAELRESGRIPGLSVHVAHVNYGLRGKDSDGDEAYVRELAARFNMAVTCERAAPGTSARGSFQESARVLRYAFFERLCREHRLTSVATGHTADDQAETILMWLIRGTGLDGLRGIPGMRVDAEGALEGRIIRPLLDVRRQDVLEYLDSRDVSYRIDTSNASDVYRRNRIRHELLPLLQSFNPRIVESLARGADILASDASVVDGVEDERWEATVITAVRGSAVLDCGRLMSQPLALRRRLIRRALAIVRGSRAGLTFLHVAQALDCAMRKRNGSGIDLPGGIRVQREENHLVMQFGSTRSVGFSLDREKTAVLSIPGEVQVDGYRRIVAVPLLPEERTSGANDRWHATVDADRLEGPLAVRFWKPGDSFCPKGMKGHRKKLQDLFIDEKVPRALRSGVPLVVAPRGIVWVVGYRCDERFAVRTDTVRPVMLSVSEGE